MQNTIVKTSLLSKSIMMVVSMATLQSAFALEAMNDEQLANSTAQGEFLTIRNIGANEAGNPNPNVGFTRLTLNSKLELNMNINELRLGCDNSDYTNCDINIDKVILAGKIPLEANGNATDFPTFGNVLEKYRKTKLLGQQWKTPEDVAPKSDFVMNNPFLEFAIQNPDSLTDRKMVGFRFGAHEVWGSMSTGDGPSTNGVPNVPKLYGPTCNSSGCDENNLKEYTGGDGLAKITNMYNEIVKSSSNPGIETCSFNTCKNKRQARYDDYFTKWLNDSIEGVTPLNSPSDKHSGVNTISGRLPVMLDNLNINVKVRGATLGLAPEVKTAIVAGRLSRQDGGDFGRSKGGARFKTSTTYSTNANSWDKGYLRNVYLGDTDTKYTPNTWGNYVTNDTQATNSVLNKNLQVGRAPTFKRASRAFLDDMIVSIHATSSTVEALGGGDHFNAQDISTSLFHQLTYGFGDTYEEGKGSKNMAFQYQTLDGLQWMTTDRRISTSYDKYGNPTGTPTGPYDGYDWLSTRAGWWLESPLATVRDGYVPHGQVSTRGVPGKDDVIQLRSVDLGSRPVDNCYGALTFC